MTDEQINRAIAKMCGWFYYDGWHHPDGRTELPDYVGSLDAMHEVEKYLEADSWYDYALRLNEVCWHWALIHAPARQRAEAFLKTLGKWEE
jgi:hypothetical protein